MLPDSHNITNYSFVPCKFPQSLYSLTVEKSSNCDSDYESMEKSEASIPITHESSTSPSSSLSLPLFETPPSGLSREEFEDLKPAVTEFHNYQVNPGQCFSLLAQRVHAPAQDVWSIVRRFDRPQTYKHFIKSCVVREGFSMTVGDLRDVNVISGLPAATSIERLDLMDEVRRVTGFSIVGGDHRLKNYRSVTSVHEVERDGKIWTVVLESYVVDVPEGNTEEDTRLFADTVVKLNLQKLASLAEAAMAHEDRFSKLAYS